MIFEIHPSLGFLAQIPYIVNSERQAVGGHNSSDLIQVSPIERGLCFSTQQCLFLSTGYRALSLYRVLREI